MASLSGVPVLRAGSSDSDSDSDSSSSSSDSDNEKAQHAKRGSAKGRSSNKQTKAKERAPPPPAKGRHSRENSPAAANVPDRCAIAHSGTTCGERHLLLACSLSHAVHGQSHDKSYCTVQSQWQAHWWTLDENSNSNSV